MRAITWNLYHGRDRPPDPALFTNRSRICGTSERNETHIQVNRDLEREFCSVLAGADWDVALLQECPPRFASALALATGSQAHRVLTSRNWVLPATQALARRNPDLLASWEGGSNLTLVRRRAIVGREAVVLRRLPERRVMALTRLDGGLCVANLHASESELRPEDDVRRAAVAALRFAAGRPLIFGGDLNLRAAETPLFDELAGRGLRGATEGDFIDHLLAHGLKSLGPSRRWPTGRREVLEDGLAIRLSDHTPIEAELAT